MKPIKLIFLLPFLLVSVHFHCDTGFADVMDTNNIRFSYDERGVSGIASPKDPYGAQVTSGQRPLTLTVRYQVEQEDWQDLNISQSSLESRPRDSLVKYTLTDSASPLLLIQTFSTNGAYLDWDIELETTTDKSVKIGDLAINIPVVGPRGQNPPQIFEHGFMPHQFISGNGSFIYYVRASGAPPFLIVTVKPGTHLEYFAEVTFKHLGENKLTIHHDDDRKTYLEYFVTEPLETLIKKRASFIINRQQIRDPGKWWDGVFGPYDMRNQVVRTIDDPDIFTGRMIYVLTCDDPGLCKAPFVASKNVSFPDKQEIEGLEYYLEHFVWGKLQRTDEEEPYPYGVYGTPHWYIDRDPERRKAYTERDLDKEHIWRSYDYPHMVMLYFHMYEIAKKYPEMSTYLDAAGYLERAYQTARAFYKYPYEIFPSYYETYKWGLYNELVVLKLADALDDEGFANQAAWLRAEWEKKVKYFVYDDDYPFRSEYAFDRTAFESSYALAKYGATHDMQPDRHLWWDIKHKKWYSHPQVRREDSRAFMDRQLAAGLCVRGWLETNYFQLGADNTLRFKIELDRDGFGPDLPIILDKQLGRISFTLENRTKDQHLTGLRLSVHPSVAYDVLQDGKKVTLARTGNWDYPWKAELQMNDKPSKIEIIRLERP